MKPSPPSHRKAPWDAGGRLDGRLRGGTHPRAGGRKLDISPSRLPAARVASPAPRPGYRVFSEDAYLAGVDMRLGPRDPLAGAGRGRTLQRLAGAAALSGALGAGIGAVALAAWRPARTARRDTSSRLLAERASRGAGRVARASVGPASASVPASSAPSARRRPLKSEPSVRRLARATVSMRRHLTRDLHAPAGPRPVTAPATPQAGSGDQQTADAPNAVPPPAKTVPASADAQSQFGFEH